MKIEVGKTYLDTEGNVVTIIGLARHKNFPYCGDNGRTYREDGTCWYSKDPKDIVEEVVDTPKFEVGDHVEVFSASYPDRYMHKGTILHIVDGYVWVVPYSTPWIARRTEIGDRIRKLPPAMSKEEAEQKYNIRIV